MKTLEEFIKETEEEFSDKFISILPEPQETQKIWRDEPLSKELETFLSTKLQQAGEVAVEEFVKKLKDYIEEERVDGHMPFYSDDFENMFTNLLKEK